MLAVTGDTLGSAMCGPIMPRSAKNEPGRLAEPDKFASWQMRRFWRPALRSFPELRQTTPAMRHGPRSAVDTWQRSAPADAVFERGGQHATFSMPSRTARPLQSEAERENPVQRFQDTLAARGSDPGRQGRDAKTVPWLTT